MRQLPQWEFDIYALSLSRGHDFGDTPPGGAWISNDSTSCGILTTNWESKTFGITVMRRQIDGPWREIKRESGFASTDQAKAALAPDLVDDLPPAPVPSGDRLRPKLYDFGDREPNDMFKALAMPARAPALWSFAQLYFAMPRPDPNWVSDCQGPNFHTRLWEALLLASFREQGLLVEQPYESPDFRIENKYGGEAWVEPVTANPAVPYNHVNAPAVDIPTEKEELFFGTAAVRFAKTLGNKLERRYDQIPHVKGKPFILAIADFHASGSMMWSREALTAYLLGAGAKIAVFNGRQQAVSWPVDHLLGPSHFPAGLLSNDAHAELSAVITTNACTLAKLNRVSISGGDAPKGYRYTRIGQFFDRSEGALKGIPFCLDMTSLEYRALWPQGYEPWTAEMEVFHNPYALHPVPHDLIPEATHWYRQADEWMCSSFYETSILWSQTRITGIDQPAPKLEDFLRNSDAASTE